MSLGRVGFGCAVDNYGEKIFAIGGSLQDHKGTDQCEYYNVGDDTWAPLPKLPSGRFSQSLCIFSDTWLF